MFRTKIINKGIESYAKNIIKRPQSYGEYLKNETKRNKKKRLEVIKKWYDFIHNEKKIKITQIFL
tara:strand:+ start:36 stop:230 length:195 start_codon:yes stop_codon:yes gene_type:complete